MLDWLLDLGKFLIVILIVWTLLSYAWRNRHTFSIVHARWHHSFPEMQISPQEFYNSVKVEIQKKDVGSISIGTRIYTEGGLFSSDRIYLQVQRGEQLFIICAAPFGKEYFVSWWFGKAVNFMDDLVQRIPYIGKYIEAIMNYQTFYQIDTDDMFKDMVKDCVLVVVDSIANDKGIRPLTELERRPVDGGHKNV